MRFLQVNIVSALLGNTVDFSLAYGKRKLLFQPFEVRWLSSKSAAILAWPKHPSDVTNCVTLMPSSKFRVIMGSSRGHHTPTHSVLWKLIRSKRPAERP